MPKLALYLDSSSGILHAKLQCVDNLIFSLLVFPPPSLGSCRGWRSIGCSCPHGRNYHHVFRIKRGNVLDFHRGSAADNALDLLCFATLSNLVLLQKQWENNMHDDNAASLSSIVGTLSLVVSFWTCTMREI
uniref:Uncharacterized protein n=1 Tax=Ditylum brightwellii TaxID=49249 RepID=A0A7S4T3L3_9STRA